MATDTLKAGIPIIDLDTGMSVVFEAIDPTTGLAVAGVVVSGVAMYGDGDTTTSEAAIEPPRLGVSLLPG